MKTYVIYLKPAGPFHLQTGGLDHESVDVFPRADTVSAAISWLWFRQFGQMEGFPDEIPFQVSSFMPAVMSSESDEVVRLYPKPAGISINPGEIDHKIFKSIDWLDPFLFEKWRTGDFNKDDLPSDTSDSRLQCKGSVLTSKGTKLSSKKLYETFSRTRVVLDRVNNASTPFHFVSVRYASDFCFALHFRVNEEKKATFLAMLRILGDEGIGADRTVGMGTFEVISNPEEVSFSEPANCSGWLNIGLFNPGLNTADIDWGNSAYTLGRRSGWVTGTPYRRGTIPVVEEKSVLIAPAMPVGSVQKVLDHKILPAESQLDYDVYRDCRGFFIPYKF